MLKLYSKFQDPMLKSFEVINTFTCQFSPVLVQCFSSLTQAVTSQAENCEHLQSVLIEYVSELMFKYNVFSINEVNLFEKEYSAHAKLGFGNSACDVTASFSSSMSGYGSRGWLCCLWFHRFMGIKYHSEICFDVI